MGKGSPRITVRVCPLKLAEIMAAIKAYNEGSSQIKHHTLTSWVLDAIDEKLDHARRSKESSKKRRSLAK